MQPGFCSTVGVSRWMCRERWMCTCAACGCDLLGLHSAGKEWLCVWACVCRSDCTGVCIWNPQGITDKNRAHAAVSGGWRMEWNIVYWHNTFMFHKAISHTESPSAPLGMTCNSHTPHTHSAAECFCTFESQLGRPSPTGPFTLELFTIEAFQFKPVHLRISKKGRLFTSRDLSLAKAWNARRPSWE